MRPSTPRGIGWPEWGLPLPPDSSARMPHIESFRPEGQDKLRSYVYRLIDPRNGETFYVGKGQRNRVFAHIREEEEIFGGDELDRKLERIRQIHAAGFEVAHVIHRHGNGR